VLALTPVPLKTAGERAVFGELTRWDTGGSVRAAVMASIPLADGASQRRMSDAVLFVPEGLAVVRIAEIVRQSGVVTASPEGAWTIAPESGPSQALQLSGGGSTPLDGLMRAGMDTAMKLRRAGLEPGRIARLTILVGNVTGLLPADGDLGEGDQVALLEPRSLLLGIARASRYAGVDNPRLWTTADVRAALETLGLEGRGPTVEELNGESFPYSPYVLRRADLLTPAAMAASASAAPEAPAAPASSPGPAPVPPVREQPSPEAIAQAVAASAAAAQAAQHAPPAVIQQAAPAVAQPPAGPVPAQRDTVAIDAPQDDDAGIAGLFADAEPDRADAESSARTSVFPASGPPPRTSVFPAQPQAEAPDAPPVAFWSRSEAAEPSVDGAEERGSRRRTGLLVAAALVVVALLGVGGWFLLGGQSDDSAGGRGTAGGSPTAEAPPGPEVGDVQAVAGTSYTVQAVDLKDTCAGHAYGAVAESFGGTDCTGLSRALYSTDVGGEEVVVSVIRVRMPDAAAARDLRSLADQNGSGNVSDLLREGVRYSGSPAELSGAEYASALSGSTVTIVEAAWVDPDAEGGSAEIDRVAGEALALEVPPFPGS
jgi:hypothetical protein